MAKKIFILNECDVWKSYSSMSLVMATTSTRKIKNAVIDKLESLCFNYNRGEPRMSKREQIKLFKRDFRQDQEFAFNNIDFAYVAVVEDGELQ